MNRLDSTIQNEVLNDQPESIIVEESENAAEDTAVSETVTEMTDDMLQAELEADMAALDAIE